jgi:hypothetical protein
LWELVCTALAGKGCDCVLARLEKFSGEIAAYTARGLENVPLENAFSFLMGIILHTPTIATLSIRLTNPAGWSLAFLGDILDGMDSVGSKPYTDSFDLAFSFGQFVGTVD